MLSGLPETPETRGVIETVTKRVLARMERGEGPPARSIPRSKGDFPKVLCLDENKWIDLARAHYGREDGARFVDALAAVRVALARNTLMVPIMPSNLLEVSEPSDQGRRERLAQFLVDISGNHAFSKPNPVAELHAYRAIRALFLGEDIGPFPREKLVAWGVDFALGFRLTGNDFLVQVSRKPENSVLALVHAMSRESIAEGRRMDERAAAVGRAARVNGDRPERLGEELTALFGSGGNLLHDVVQIDRPPWDRARSIRPVAGR